MTKTKGTLLSQVSILIKSKCVSVSQSVSVGLEPRVELKPGRERGERERERERERFNYQLDHQGRVEYTIGGSVHCKYSGKS